MKEHGNDPKTNSEQHEGGVIQNNTETPPEFSPREPHHNPIGAIIGTVILFALLILGGLYAYGNRLSTMQTNEGTSSEEQAGEDVFSEESEQSDDLETLEQELGALEDFENMGADLESSFDAEFAE